MRCILRDRKRAICILAITALLPLSWACDVVDSVVVPEGSGLAVPLEEHLGRYPDMQVFLVDRTDFHGLFHDTQTGFYTFWFHTDVTDAETYFARVERVMVDGEQWRRVLERPSLTIYERRGDEPKTVCVSFPEGGTSVLYWEMQDSYRMSEWLNEHLVRITTLTGSDWGFSSIGD